MSVLPRAVAPGTTHFFVFSVPNDHRSAAIQQVTIGLPPGIVVRAIQTHAGWTGSSTSRTVTWKGGRIPRGQFANFALRASVPDTPGTLVFVVQQVFTDEASPSQRAQVRIRGAAATADDDDSSEQLSRDAVAVALAAAALALGSFLFALTFWLRAPRLNHRSRRGTLQER